MALIIEANVSVGVTLLPTQEKIIVFRTLGFILSTLGSVPSNVFTVVLGTLNTFDGTDPKVDRVKPKVRNSIFSPCANNCALQAGHLHMARGTSYL